MSTLARIFLLLGMAVFFTHPSQAAPHALVLDIEGAISPAVAEDVARAINLARESDARLLILRMDTPGGLDKSMRSIIKGILASPVPVACFVAPQGARAASAGTYILYASHIAAMAPATNLGAATPVQIGGLPSIEPPGNRGGKEEQKAEKSAPSGDAMQHKMVNDAAAYIRSLAALRGRNADWAEKAVREAASLNSEQALEQKVVDLLAGDIAELLEAIDGRSVTTSDGSIRLETKGLELKVVEQNWRSKLLAVITDPNVAYVLMLLGIYGLFFELANPGFVLPGVIGGICLLLALFAFQVLPINFAGLGLMLLGILFMIAEAFAPSFGALGLGGVIAFVAGSVMLMDTSIPGYGLSMSLIVGVALASALFFVFIIGMALKARRRPVVSGAEEMLGAIGVASESFSGSGHVLVHGEIWQAESTEPLNKGDPVRVTSRDGLTLHVIPNQETAKESNS